MTAANKITLSRLLLVPLFVALLIYYGNGGGDSYRLAAIICFAIASIGDALDGYVARHFNQRTDLGAILDAAADKLLLVSALTCLCVNPGQKFVPVPLWLLLIVLTRELILVAGMCAIHFTAGKFEAHPRLAGKLATIVQMTMVLWTLLKSSPSVIPFLVYTSGSLILISGAYYLYDFTRQFQRRTAGELQTKSV